MQSSIHEALSSLADEQTRLAGERFFKETVRMYGVKSADVHRIEKEVWQELRAWAKADVWALCDAFWQSGYFEQGQIAAMLSHRLHKRFEPTDFYTFERWVRDEVTNWAACDALCNHTMGDFVTMYPARVADLKRWTASENRWMRRAAAVSLIVPARRGLFLEDALQIADALLLDPDDLVQKGYGWLLKAASMSESFVKGTADVRQAHLDAVFQFVLDRRTTMPRTALRYAIEKMPADLRAEAMRR